MPAAAVAVALLSTKTAAAAAAAAWPSASLHSRSLPALFQRGAAAGNTARALGSLQTEMHAHTFVGE